MIRTALSRVLDFVNDTKRPDRVLPGPAVSYLSTAQSLLSPYFWKSPTKRPNWKRSPSDWISGTPEIGSPDA